MKPISKEARLYNIKEQREKREGEREYAGVSVVALVSSRKWRLSPPIFQFAGVKSQVLFWSRVNVKQEE